MIFLKLSLAIFFLRIMVKRWQKWTIYAIAFVTTLMGTGYFFFSLFTCGFPVEAHLYWEKRIARKCASFASILGISYAHAGVNTLTDLLLAILPVTMVKKSKMNTKEKYVVTGIFFIATA
jgi:hypothetical protein